MLGKDTLLEGPSPMLQEYARFVVIAICFTVVSDAFKQHEIGGEIIKTTCTVRWYQRNHRTFFYLTMRLINTADSTRKHGIENVPECKTGWVLQPEWYIKILRKSRTLWISPLSIGN